jgi:adenine-specific DNA-methyltransferase
MARSPKAPLDVETLRHADKRLNIPTAEVEPVMRDEDKAPVRVAYERRNRDLDPQLVWRGKDEQDWSDLVVAAPPLYIQEKLHPKALVDDLMREAAGRREAVAPETPDLFADFNGLPDREAAAEFYQHQANWANRMILGDSLQVMASLAEREGLRGQVQCIYIDPPYGIRFNSNFQWSTTSRDVKDGNPGHITREPEMVKAFRDTWRDGIHSYLTYLRDRLTVARDLLHESGSIFVQIGDENVHRVRAVMDEVFGDENFISLISVQTTTGFLTDYLGNMSDFVLWFAKDKSKGKTRPPFYRKEFVLGEGNARWLMFSDFTYRGVTAAEKRGDVAGPDNARPYKPDNIISQGRAKERQPFEFHGRIYDSWEKNSHWKASHPIGMNRLALAGRIHVAENSIQYVRYHTDFDVGVHGNIWTDTGTGNFTDEKVYVVQTNTKVVERCILMTTDPGDLVLDPTCGSGTTATVAEQWGRRWITIDTSRVALALARARIMGARYPFYLLRDTEEGVRKEAGLRRLPPADEALAAVRRPGHKPDLRQGFVYERVPHITLKSIANNAEIDVIWEAWQAKLEPLRARLNAALGEAWEEWEVLREAGKDWPAEATEAHAQWWQARIARQREIDASIAAKADYEFLYDKPYGDNGKIRVAGPFTVESLSPHRTMAVDQHDELVDLTDAAEGKRVAPEGETDFAAMVLENLKTSGVQQMEKGDRIAFSGLTPWPGRYIAAEGRYQEGEDGPERRAGVLIGPEFGTVQRADLVAAARECADAGFDILVACGFSFSAQCTDFTQLGRIRVLRARMNPDLHMADDLKNTGTGNLFVVFGEPDIDILEDGGRLRVKIRGVDVFKPQTGEIESSGPEGIACWFIDTDYNEESFFVRHAYFLGANDPYKALKTTLKAEIDAEAWESLHSDVSRPFDRPSTGRIAVKVINHLGDEVMKVFGVG